MASSTTEYRISQWSPIVESTIVVFGSTQVCEPAAAQKVLRSTGVQGGLVVHLGCGDGRVVCVASLFTKAKGVEGDGELHTLRGGRRRS